MHLRAMYMAGLPKPAHVQILAKIKNPPAACYLTCHNLINMLSFAQTNPIYADHPMARSPGCDTQSLTTKAGSRNTRLKDVHSTSIRTPEGSFKSGQA